MYPKRTIPEGLSIGIPWFTLLRWEHNKKNLKFEWSWTIIQGRKLFKGGNYQSLEGFDWGKYSKVESIQVRKLFARNTVCLLSWCFFCPFPSPLQKNVYPAYVCGLARLVVSSGCFCVIWENFITDKHQPYYAHWSN